MPIWAGRPPARTRDPATPSPSPDLSPGIDVPPSVWGTPTRPAMHSRAEPSPRLRDSFRALPRTAWILFAGTFVLRLGSFVFPFLALYLTGRASR